MLFAFAGLYLSFRRLKPFFFPVLIFSMVYLWVTFSWWCWWYGGSFGQRSMIDIFPLMAVMIAVFVKWLWQKKIWLKISLSFIVLLTVFMSVFYTIQYRYGALHWDSMSKAAYFNNFGHMEPYGQYWSLVICPDNEKAKTGIQDTVPRH
jgi:hypothetical protein